MSIDFNADTYITPPGRERRAYRLMLRSRLYYICGFLGVMFGYWPEARRGRLGFAGWHRAASDIFSIIEHCGGRFHITGLQNLRAADGPVVFIANHMSTLETLVPPAFIYPHKKPVFVIKQQLRDLPFFGAYVRNCITVSRTSPAQDFKQVMTKGCDAVKNGGSVIVFPQATRTPDIDPETFNTLGVKLARKAGVPALPLAIKSDFWGVGKLVKDFGPLDHSKTIHFEFAAPRQICGNGREEHEWIIRFIRERIATWRTEEQSRTT